MSKEEFRNQLSLKRVDFKFLNTSKKQISFSPSVSGTSHR